MPADPYNALARERVGVAVAPIKTALGIHALVSTPTGLNAPETPPWQQINGLLAAYIVRIALRLMRPLVARGDADRGAGLAIAVVVLDRQPKRTSGENAKKDLTRVVVIVLGPNRSGGDQDKRKSRKTGSQ